MKYIGRNIEGNIEIKRKENIEEKRKKNCSFIYISSRSVL